MFCPKCNNLYDVTDNINKTQHGSSYNMTSKDIINNILSDNELSSIYSIQKITKSKDFRGLSDDDKKKIKDYLKEKKIEIEKNSENIKNNKAYFICSNCGNYEEIQDETLIAGKYFESNNKKFDYTDYINDSTLPITRNYICYNKNCESHKDPSKKQAVFFRDVNSYKITYICKTCGTIQNNN